MHRFTLDGDDSFDPTPVSSSDLLGLSPINYNACLPRKSLYCSNVYVGMIVQVKFVKNLKLISGVNTPFKNGNDEVC